MGGGRCAKRTEEGCLGARDEEAGRNVADRVRVAGGLIHPAGKLGG